jgi:hypothetical protein
MVHNCFAGKELCSSGSWTACQDLAELVGVRTQNFVGSCPSGAELRWTTLDYVFDVPSNASGAAAVTVSVAGDPEVVLFDSRSAGDAPVHGGVGSRTVDALLGALSAQSALTLQIATTTTPDGAMAATAKVVLRFGCEGSTQ